MLLVPDVTALPRMASMSMQDPPNTRRAGRPNLFEHDDLEGRRSTAFKAAIKHSRRVYILRRGLPIIAGGSIVLVALWLWVDPLRFAKGLPSVEVGALKISGTKLTMDAPKLTGFSKDGHPYSIVAESAAQDLTKTSVIELTNVTGRFDLGERGDTVLNAKSGVYDSKTEQMRLFNGINIRSTRGYTGKFIEAKGEPKKGHMVSESPVEIIFSDGDLRANRMEVFDQGNSIVFEAGVVLTLKNLDKASVSAVQTPAEGQLAQKKK